MNELRRAFFVGDILTKRDCQRLQNLAPNCQVINMYGTTETQRAVSYFRVLSLNEQPSFLDTISDIIPAGKGMRSVQLLVVTIDNNNEGRLCGVGELGEIFVRSSGLSENHGSANGIVKQMPMFQVPEQPVHDIDMGAMNGGG